MNIYYITLGILAILPSAGGQIVGSEDDCEAARQINEHSLILNAARGTSVTCGPSASNASCADNLCCGPNVCLIYSIAILGRHTHTSANPYI